MDYISENDGIVPEDIYPYRKVRTRVHFSYFFFSFFLLLCDSIHFFFFVVNISCFLVGAAGPLCPLRFSLHDFFFTDYIHSHPPSPLTRAARPSFVFGNPGVHDG